MSRRRWKEPPQVSGRVSLLNLREKCHYFLKIKMGKWGLKFLLSNYRKDIVLGSVETPFLEVAAYVSPKRSITDLWEGRFWWIWVKIAHFFKYWNGEWEQNVLFFNYWNDFILGWVETYFLEVSAYMSVKRATAGVWEGRFFRIWVKILHLLKYRNEGVGLKDFTV